MPNARELPTETADRFTKPLARFLRIEAAAGGLLLAATLVALILANSAWSGAYAAFLTTPVGVLFGSFEFTRSLWSWINDGLMTLFFFVVALELKRQLAIGELRGLRTATLPIAGALGGMLVPAAVYLAIMDGRPGAQGWGTVMATDTAFVIGCLALLGARLPPSLRLFLLSLAIFDDVGAILIVAVGYGHALAWPALGLALLSLGAVAGAARLGIRSVAAYYLLGVMTWLSFDASGIHPTVAGVILALMTPTRAWVSDERLRAILGRVLSYPTGEHWSGDTEDRQDLRRASVATSEALSPLERLEMTWHGWVAFAVMPIFALASAGIPLSGARLGEPATFAIFMGLAVGKPVGVLAATWLAVWLGVATRPPTLSWPLIAAGAPLTGIGFTMSLFIAGRAFDPAALNAAKIGILAASGVSAAVGLAALTWVVSRRRRDAGGDVREPGAHRRLPLTPAGVQVMSPREPREADKSEERSAEERRTQRWENEGGSTRPPSRRGKSNGGRREPRSHNFGEGSTSRTITQDEQDRLAQRRDNAGGS